MIHVVFGAVLLAYAVGSPVYDQNQVDYLQAQLDSRVPSEKVFQDFKRVFNKTYKDDVEEETRKAIFQINAKYIDEHNLLYAKGKKSYTLAVNEFTDLHHEEFMMLYTGYRPLFWSTNGSTFIPASNANLAPSVDWRTKNCVTAVKNQGHCGSCWAFSTTGSVEGQYARKTGKLESLSEQQLVDCSTQNNGCNGGLMDTAFKYIGKVGGLERESDYPYTAKQGSCAFRSGSVVTGTAVTGFTDIPRGNENMLQQAVAENGPVSVAIDANHPSFQLYSGGVYDEPSCSSTKLDHGVLVIGYGSETQDYWLVKNSWGTSWGDSGYIKMSRNKGNQCGIASQASYPRL